MGPERDNHASVATAAYDKNYGNATKKCPTTFQRTTVDPFWD
jgi:hypothetical protein